MGLTESTWDSGTEAASCSVTTGPEGISARLDILADLSEGLHPLDILAAEYNILRFRYSVFN